MWIPALIALKNTLHLLKVHHQVLLLSIVTAKVHFHLVIVTSLKHFLLLKLIVVEVGIEVFDLLRCDITRAHTVLPDDSFGCVVKHSSLMSILALHSNCTDSHGFFGG